MVKVDSSWLLIATLALASASSACATLNELYSDDVFLPLPASDLAERHVEIAYFVPAGAGDYVLLSNAGSSWKVKQVSQERPSVAAGEELLFVRRVAEGGFEITPVFDAVVSRESRLFVCEDSDPTYNPCRSAFAYKGTIMAPKRRAIDRKAIALAVKSANVFQAIEADAAQRAQSERNAGLAATIQARVVAVSNEPALVKIDPSELQALAMTSAVSAGQGFSARIRFRDFERELPTGTVHCAVRSEQPEYAASAQATVDVKAVVDDCDFRATHPFPFEVAEKGQAVSATLDLFSPQGASRITLVNHSTSFVTVSSVSLYYFSEILTTTGKQELPPNANDHVDIVGSFVDHTFHHATRANAEKLSFNFGIAVKYTDANSAVKTLYALRPISLKGLLPGG